MSFDPTRRTTTEPPISNSISTTSTPALGPTGPAGADGAAGAAGAAGATGPMGPAGPAGSGSGGVTGLRDTAVEGVPRTGPSSVAAFNTLFTSIGTADTELHVAPGTYVIDSALTIPKNVQMRMDNGAYFTISDGVTLLMRRVPKAERFHIFRKAGTTGKVRFTDPAAPTQTSGPVGSVVYPEWWGAKTFMYGDAITDSTQAFADMIAAVSGYPDTGETLARWAKASIELSNGYYRLSAGVAGSAIKATSLRGFTMKGQGVEKTYIECADGTGVALATPAKAMLDLDGCFNAHIEGFTIGGYPLGGTGGVGQGNYRYGVYYHREDTTSALGSSLLRAVRVEVMSPWITAGWQIGAGVGSSSFQRQEDNTYIEQCFARQPSGYIAGSSYHQRGFSFGTGVYANNLNHHVNTIDAVGCKYGLYLDSTNVLVDGGEFGANDTDIYIQQGIDGYSSIRGIRSENCRMFYDSYSTQSIWQELHIGDCLVHINNLVLDGSSGFAQWGRHALPGRLTMERIKIAAQIDRTLVPKLILSRVSTVILDGLAVDNSPFNTALEFQTSTTRVSVRDYIELDANNDTKKITAPGMFMLLRDPASMYLRPTIEVGKYGADADAIITQHKAGVVGMSAAEAGSLRALAFGAPAAPFAVTHLGGSTGSGATVYEYAVVFKDGAGRTSLVSATSTTITNGVLTGGIFGVWNRVYLVPSGATETAPWVKCDVVRRISSGAWRIVAQNVHQSEYKWDDFSSTVDLGAFTAPAADTTGTLRADLAFGLGLTPVLRQAVTGSRGANAALASLLTALAAFGLITDSSS